MTLLCKFCQKDTAYVPLQVRTRKFEVHYCYACSAEYVEYGDTKAIHIYTVISNRMYRWSVNEITEQPDYGTIWYVGEPGEPGIRPNKKMKLLKSFTDYLPQITPNNIQSKLRFMLLFL